MDCCFLYAAQDGTAQLGDGVTPSFCAASPGALNVLDPELDVDAAGFLEDQGQRHVGVLGNGAFSPIIIR